MNTPTTNLPEIRPHVEIIDGHIKTNSLRVAEHFGKLHKNVLRDIENLECSAEFSRLNFEPRDYIDERGKTQPMIEMTRDGFTILVMGFTGKEAMQWKEAYIAAFNKMEVELRTHRPKLEDDIEAQMRQKIRAFLSARPEGCASQTVISNHCFHKNPPLPVCHVLNAMVAEYLLEVETLPRADGRHGRPKHVYRLLCHRGDRSAVIPPGLPQALSASPWLLHFEPDGRYTLVAVRPGTYFMTMAEFEGQFRLELRQRGEVIVPLAWVDAVRQLAAVPVDGRAIH